MEYLANVEYVAKKVESLISAEPLEAGTRTRRVRWSLPRKHIIVHQSRYTPHHLYSESSHTV